MYIHRVEARYAFCRFLCIPLLSFLYLPDKLLATLRRGDTSDSMKDCEEEEEESLLIVLRPDGHVLDIFDLRERVHGANNASLSSYSSERISNHQTEIEKLVHDILLHRLP